MDELENYSAYSISEAGEVFALHLGRNICQYDNGLGYMAVKLRNNSGARKQMYVHRLVALCYIPNVDNLPDVNHIDGNKKNNNVNNLEWCTRSENLKHAFEKGLLSGYIKTVAV